MVRRQRWCRDKTRVSHEPVWDSCMPSVHYVQYVSPNRIKLHAANSMLFLVLHGIPAGPGNLNVGRLFPTLANCTNADFVDVGIRTRIWGLHSLTARSCISFFQLLCLVTLLNHVVSNGKLHSACANVD